MCPPWPSGCPPMFLYSPAASRRLCAILRPAGGIFAPVVSRTMERSKCKTAVKAICRPVTPFFALMAIPIFPRRQTAHSGPQTAKQSAKQPRPAPSGVSRGFVICSGPGRGRRSDPLFGRTRRSGGRDTSMRAPYLVAYQGEPEPKYSQPPEADIIYSRWPLPDSLA